MDAARSYVDSVLTAKPDEKIALPAIGDAVLE